MEEISVVLFLSDPWYKTCFWMCRVVEAYSGLRDVTSYLRTEFLVLRGKEKVITHNTLLRIWVKGTGVKGHTKEKFISHFVIDCDNLSIYEYFAWKWH